MWRVRCDPLHHLHLHLHPVLSVVDAYCSTAAGNVTAYSDPRLKENFAKVENPLEILSKLDGGTFNWKRGYSHMECKAGSRDYGILADQVERVIPEIVT